ncbi:hypothetical protein F5Y14DRAFT_422296 [Nemania sp. NC0429]|nr:hypothetical protein F5Y14DRAFT_422296 [Nemania sp. NC0429]
MAESTPADTSTLSALPSAVASTVGTPQSMPPMDPEERTKSLNVSLADMVAKATALYQSKKYDEAAEIFSIATERQAELNGELAPENADALFLYGRCLFKIGQSKSDVLGGRAPNENKKKKTKTATKPATQRPQAASSSANAPGDDREETVPDAKKPLFQFNGDENFEDSDDDEQADDDGQEAEEEEEDDDLAVAFEILELSRILFEKQLEEILVTEGPDKDIAEGENKLVRHTKERLSEIHELLAEIYLEDEKFPEAVGDCRAALKYNKELYPEESELIAEAHYKLSLALEFASVTSRNDDGAEAAPQTVDEGMRTEAAEELANAIKSSKLKLQNKEVELATSHAPEDNDETRRQIADIKEVIADMEQRLTELRKPPIDMNAALGRALGESSIGQTALAGEAKKNAKDLSGLVRKKAKEEPKNEDEANGKRKAEEPAEGQEDHKKAKADEPTTAQS